MRRKAVLEQMLTFLVLASLLVGIVPPVAAYTAPSAPILNEPLAGNAQISLSWTTPSSNGSPITGYNLYRGQSPGEGTFYRTVVGATVFVDTGLTNGVTYYYYVRAVNDAGEGPASNEVYCTPLTVPGVPTSLTALPADGRAHLSWVPPYDEGGREITHYRIYRGTSPGQEVFLVNCTDTSYIDMGLTNGYTYYYKVSAVSPFGEGPASAEVSVILGDVPGSVTTVVLSSGNATVWLNWSAPVHTGGTPISGYQVYRSTAPGMETFLRNVQQPSDVDTGLTNGVTYYYRICAVNGAGAGPLSNELSATPMVVPEAPTLFQASRGDQNVTLTWSAPCNIGGSPILGYRIYRGTTSGTMFFIHLTNSSARSFVDTGLTNGLTYYYRISAVNVKGEGSLSSEVCATPLTVPGAPTALVASPGNGMVNLSWSAPADSGGGEVTRYYVYWSTSPTGTASRIDTLSNATTYSHRGLTNGVTYYYTVSAMTSGGEGPSTSQSSARPATSPGAPENLAVQGGARQTVLTWQAPANGGEPIVGYRIYRGTASGMETLLLTVGVVGTYTDTGLQDNTQYYYRVSAVNALGEGPMSGEASATTFDVPGPPRSLAISTSDSRATLSWNAPIYLGGSPIIGYNIYRGTIPGSFSRIAANVTSPFQDNGLTNGQTYYYLVRAVNGLGEGVNSSQVSGVPSRVPDAPSSLSATAGRGNISLTWSGPSSDGGAEVTGFIIYRGTSPGTELPLVTVGVIYAYLDDYLSDSATYFYRVAAINARGVGAQSLEVYATTFSLPGAPISLEAQPGSGSVFLSWSPPVSNGGAPVTSYIVYRGIASEGETYLTTVAGTSYQDEGLMNGQAYYYRVSAVNAVGEGPRSSEVQATPVEVPDAPSGLVARPSSQQVSLTWTAPVMTGGPAVTGYVVYRGASSGDLSPLTTVTSTSYLDQGLTNGQRYYYQVAATNPAGQGPRSPEVSAVPAMVPGQPTGLMASGGLRQVTLTWSAPSSDGGSAVTGYNVYRSASPDPETAVVVGRGVSMPFTDTGLVDNVTYFYQVAAVNPVGEGPRSEFASATTLEAPPAPGALTAVPADSMVTLTWSPSVSSDGSALAYRLYRSAGPGPSIVIATLSDRVFVDTGLTNGQTYRYQVTAVNATGESAPTEEATAVPFTLPTAPLNLEASPGDGEIILSWDQPFDDGGAHVTGYLLYWGTNPENLLNVIPVLDTLYIHHDLANGQRYFYRVAAINAAGEGPLSNQASAVPFSRPGVPLDLRAAGMDGKVVLTWSEPDGALNSNILGYRIYRGNSSGAETLLDVATGTSYTDTSVVNGNTYFYRISAINATGEGKLSNEASATPGSYPADILASIQGVWLEMAIIVGVVAGSIGATFVLFKKGVLSVGKGPNP